MSTEKIKKNGNLVKRTKRLANVSLTGVILLTIFKILIINVSGDSSIAYFGASFELYLFFSLALTYAISSTVEKMTVLRMSKGQYRNILTLRRISVCFSIIFGLMIGAILYFFSDFFSVLISQSRMSSFSIKVLAIAIVPLFLAAPLLGYFQGIGTMMPSAVYQLTNKIIMLISGIPLLILVYQYGIKVGNLMHNEAYASAYGGMGASFAILAGTSVSLLFLIFVFIVYNRQFKHILSKERFSPDETWKQILGGFIRGVLPFTFYGILFGSLLVVDQSVFSWKMAESGKLDSVPTLWGNFYGKYFTLIFLTAVFVSSQGKVLETELRNIVGRVDNRIVKEKIHNQTQITVMMSLPWIVLFGLDSEAVVGTFFNGNLEIATQLLQIGCVGVMLLAIAFLQFHIMIGIKKVQICSLIYVIAMIVHIPIMLLLMNVTQLDVEAVVISEMGMLLIFIIANQIFIRKHFKMKQEPGKYLLISLTSAVAVGVVVFIINRLLSPVIGGVLVSLISFIFVWIGYLVLLIVYRALDSRILQMLPFGDIIIKIAVKLHLMIEE